jgi:hypothetical protein
MKTRFKLAAVLSAALLASNVAFAEDAELSGKLVCSKCTLKETADCRNVLQVKADGAMKNYYIAKTDASKKVGIVCHDVIEGVSAAGKIETKDGKLTLSPSKMEVPESK